MIESLSAQRFECPLCRSCLTPSLEPFDTYDAANAAVVRYKEAGSPADSQLAAHELFLRHIPLLRKSLSQACQSSECFPGGCMVEELMGETYPIFQQALDDFDPDRGVDFSGFLSQRLSWSLGHVVRRLKRWGGAGSSEAPETTPSPDAEGERALNRLILEQMLASLDPEDVVLVTGYAAGHTYGELSAKTGIPSAALRKRMQRLRKRLRRLTEQ